MKSLYFLAFIILFSGIQSKKPNILMIVIDDLGWNDLGWSQRSHGFNNTVQTPFLDSLAEGGVILNQYYVNPLCSPTRATFMTGRYTIHNAVEHILWADQSAGLPLNETLLPQLLKENGYQTHAIGKWHLGFYKFDYTPTFRGFDTYLGYYVGCEDYFNHSKNGWVDFHKEMQPNCGWGCSEVLNRTGIYSSNVFTDRAIDIILNQTEEDDPFFMYLAYQAVHQPMEAPQYQIDKYDDIISKKSQRILAGMATDVDEGIRNVSQALEKKGLLNDTLIVVTTDNGGIDASSNYPLRARKATIWEGGTRGIAFVNGWGIDESMKGTTSNELVQSTDWFKTFVEGIAQGDTANKTLPLDSYNQWDVISKGEKGERNEVVYCDPKTPQNFGLRQNNYKLLRSNFGNKGTWDAPKFNLQNDGEFCEFNGDNSTQFLFDLSVDEGEHNNIFDENPEIVEKIMSRIIEIDQTIVNATANKDPECPKPIPYNDSVMGLTWMPWCNRTSEILIE